MKKKQKPKQKSLTHELDLYVIEKPNKKPIFYSIEKINGKRVRKSV